MTFRFTLNTLIMCIIYVVGKTGCYNMDFARIQGEPRYSTTSIMVEGHPKFPPSLDLCSFGGDGLWFYENDAIRAGCSVLFGEISSYQHSWVSRSRGRCRKYEGLLMWVSLISLMSRASANFFTSSSTTFLLSSPNFCFLWATSLMLGLMVRWWQTMLG